MDSKTEQRIEIWGIAAGRRSTAGAWRHYPIGKPVPESDWHTIVSRSEVEAPSEARS